MSFLAVALQFHRREILKGGVLPPECIEEFSDSKPKASELTARQLIDQVWETRSVPNLDRTSSSLESPKFKSGDKVIWRAQINPAMVKSAKGVVLAATVTAALVRFAGRRVAWCSIRQLEFDRTESALRALTL